MLPPNTAAVLAPAFANASRFVGPALRQGARDGIRLVGAGLALYGVIAATICVGAGSYAVYRGGHALASPARRLLQRINPVPRLADHFDRQVDRRIDEILAERAPITVDATAV